MIAEDQDGEDTQDDEDGKGKRRIDTKRFTTISPGDASVVTNKKAGFRSAKSSTVIVSATREKLQTPSKESM